MIILLGATGYTGRLVARELAAGPAPFTLAARDPRRLADLAAGFGGVPTVVVDVADLAPLAAVLAPGHVVINCVGPFTELGEPVIRACIAAGAHYLDTTGEQPWMADMAARHDAPARDAGVTIVNGMAFEYAPGDAAAAHAAEGLARPLRSLDVIYAWRGTASSRGTRATVLRMLGRRGHLLEGGRVRRRSLGARRRSVRLDGGERLAAVTFTAGEVVTVPRHVAVETVRGWAVVGRAIATLLPLVAPALPVLLPPLRPLLAPFVLRRPDPTAAEREASRFTIRVEATGADGTAAAVEVHGRDPYGLTAAIIVAGAQALEGDAPTGVIAPSQLVAPAELFALLAARGVHVARNAAAAGV